MTEPTTPDAVAASEEEAASAGLKERNLQFVLLKAIADAAAKQIGQLRAGHLEPLLARYDDEGTTSYKVRLPGVVGADSLVATVTLAVPKDSLEIANLDAFIAWCEANHPEAVHVEHFEGEPERTEVVPAVPPRTEKTLVEKKVTALFKQLKVADEGIVDPSTGMLVEGVKNVPGSRPNKFSVVYEPDGVEQIVGAYRAGKLDHVVAGTTLPQVAGQVTVVERRLESVPSSLAQPRDPGEAPPEDVDVDALGPEYSDGYALAGEPTDLVDASGYGRLNAAGFGDGPPAAAAAEFDPGDW